LSTGSRTAQRTPELIFETFNAYHRTQALKAAIQLDIFTAIGEGAVTPAAIAARCAANERATRILCDYLTVAGFLTKDAQRYALTPDSAFFLDRRSPACIASAADFLTHPDVMNHFSDLAAVVRNGGSLSGDQGTIQPDNPIWVRFARSMAALQRPNAEGVAAILNADAGEKCKLLDIAAGHGEFGVTVARHNPHAEIFAVDWPAVLQVAAENARAAGVEQRHHLIPGNAFEVAFGSGYDVALVTGFLHHFDPPAIETLMRKVHTALAPNGRAVTVEFVPNEDRVSPPIAASFSMVMLGSTRGGEAYPLSEYDRMLRNAGFSSNELRPLPGGGQSAILSLK
jgi:2-polyprenyl-3-methyl-5-hydroxy-6-metoxy-1,4-benzoquinol methylase/predicted transcriptional regulator